MRNIHLDGFRVYVRFLESSYGWLDANNNPKVRHPMSNETQKFLEKLMAGKVTLEQLEKYSSNLEYSEAIELDRAIKFLAFLNKKLKEHTQ